MSDYAENEKIALEHIRETGESGKRVRFVLTVIVTASILVFASWWNSLSFSWKKNRIQSLEILYCFIEHCEYHFPQPCNNNYYYTDTFENDSLLEELKDGKYKDIVAEVEKSFEIDTNKENFPERLKLLIEYYKPYIYKKKVLKTS